MDLGAAFPLLMVNSVVIGYVLQEGSSWGVVCITDAMGYWDKDDDSYVEYE